MSRSIYYFVEGEDESGVSENISELEGPTDENAYSLISNIDPKYHYLYGTEIPQEDYIHRVNSLYEKLINSEYKKTVDLNSIFYLRAITQKTRDMLVHFSEVSSAYILSYEDLQKIYKECTGIEKRHFKVTLDKLKNLVEDGYSCVKIVFYVEP